MTLIRPFRGLRPESRYAQDVIAPPYDVVNRAEALQIAHDKPKSFLHISKPEIDLAESVDPYDSLVYDKAVANAHALIEEHVLQQDNTASYYIYRMELNGHQQTGIVATVSVEAYRDNRVRIHEYTRPEKEDDRVKHMAALRGQLSPVLITYRNNATLTTLMTRVTQTAPVYDQLKLDNVKHSVWAVTEPDLITALSDAFNALPLLYIADGHHRSAAAERVAAMFPENINAQYFLAVLIPEDEMQILSYNRVLSELPDMSERELLDKIAEKFTLTKIDNPDLPCQAYHYLMYLNETWYECAYKHFATLAPDPRARLDVSVLHNELIEPLFGISDPRADKRIDFVGGSRGISGLEERVKSGEMKIAFALPPTQMQQLLAVADAGAVMPPKSTWFEPKLADGLVSYLYEDVANK